MTIKELLQIGKTKLKNVSQTPSLDLEVLVGHVLGLSRTDLILKDHLELNEKQVKDVLGLIERRKQNEPIAYLINKKEFYGLEFYVDENVLIPRPETEVLVVAVIEFCGMDPRVKHEDDKLIVDVGTGSGCIPISLAKNLADVDFIAIDVSEDALEVAEKNVEKFGLEKRIQLICGDLLEGVDSRFHGNDKTVGAPLVGAQVVITANLPYVEDKAELEADVKDYEPHLALFSGEDGLNHYRKLLVQVAEIKPLAIFLEIDPKQVEVLKETSGELLSEYEIEVLKDLAGKERVFVLKR